MCHSRTTEAQETTSKHTTENSQHTEPQTTTTNNKRNKYAIAVTILAITLLCGGGIYWYNIQAENNAENNEYEFALSSEDPAVLKKYLDTYPQASDAHRDMIQQRLDKQQKINQAWTDAAVSGSRTSFQEFLENYPDSPFKETAIHKMDSIDWSAAKEQNTIEAYQAYLRDQPSGEHFDEANDAIRTLNTKTVQPEEEIMVSILFRSFFQSLNNKDEKALSATINPVLTSFLGKTDATLADAVTFMNKIYKSDVAKMDWHVSSDYSITKKEIGDQKYEYSVDFSAVQDVENTNSTTTRNNFKIKAKVSPDCKITELNMVRILE